jgi:hypothetical protein
MYSLLGCCFPCCYSEPTRRLVHVEVGPAIYQTEVMTRFTTVGMIRDRLQLPNYPILHMDETTGLLRRLDEDAVIWKLRDPVKLTVSYRLLDNPPSPEST